MNYKTFLIITFLIVFGQFKTFAQGDLVLTPSRVVFKPNKIKEIVNLVNTGKTTKTYFVSFVQRRMNEDGSFAVVTKPDPGQNFADAHLRIYPRSVTLKPGEGQVIMLQRRRNSNNKTGEYRSHLYFRSNPDYSALGDTNLDSVNGVSVKLTPIYGMTIPVIFHSGKVTVKSNITDVKLKSQKEINRLSFTVNRDGNKSIYGDFVVKYFPVKGKPIKISRLNGIAIYTNIKRRFMSIDLKKGPLINYNEGTIKIIYKSRPGEKKQSIFAESILAL